VGSKEWNLIKSNGGFYDPNKGKQAETQKRYDFLPSDIVAYNNLTPTDTLKLQNDPKYQLFLLQKKQIMDDPNADIQDILDYSAGGKPISETADTQLTKYTQAFENISTLTKDIARGKTGPIQ
jgi:hypothetical protein